MFVSPYLKEWKDFVGLKDIPPPPLVHFIAPTLYSWPDNLAIALYFMLLQLAYQHIL